MSRSAYRSLSPAQRRFVDGVVGGKKGTDMMRAIRPHLKRPDVRAAQWRALPVIREAMAEREAVAMAEAGVTAVSVLLALARNAYYDPRKLYHADGRPKAVHELDEESAAVVQGIDVKTDTRDRGGKLTKSGTPMRRLRRVQRIKYSLPKRNEALTLLGRHLKLFTDQHELTGKDGEPLLTLPNSALDIARRIAFVLAKGQPSEPSESHSPSDPAIGAQQSAEQTSQQAPEQE